jgi:vacuolar-type H+-ATPase subunit E/Vma4
MVYRTGGGRKITPKEKRRYNMTELKTIRELADAIYQQAVSNQVRAAQAEPSGAEGRAQRANSPAYQKAIADSEAAYQFKRNVERLCDALEKRGMK